MGNVANKLKKIFEVTGGLKRYDIIEEYSRKKAAEMGLQFDDTNECEYFQHVFAYNSNNLENE